MNNRLKRSLETSLGQRNKATITEKGESSGKTKKWDPRSRRCLPSEENKKNKSVVEKSTDASLKSSPVMAQPVFYGVWGFDEMIGFLQADLQPRGKVSERKKRAQ